MSTNPFKPTAGKMPPILIGRQSIMEDFVEGLENGAGAPGRLMLITGQRGCGKTVLLTEFGRMAKERKWLVVSETASKGMCARLVNALASTGMKLKGLNISPSIDIAGMASASLGNLILDSVEQSAVALREAIEERLKKLPKGKGIVFTIDEAQAASVDDMVVLATTLQHVIRNEDMRDISDADKHGVALVFAALPSLMDEVVNDRVLTFLRRSVQHKLEDVPLPDVRAAYVETVGKSGKAIGEEDALEAARLSQGYPYLIQLVGYYMWRSAESRGSEKIEREDVERGNEDAILMFGQSVCAPLLDGLAAPQRQFVEVMAQDDPTPTRVVDVAKRAGHSASWANKYRASLIKKRIIVPAGQGYVKIDVPFLAEYICSQMA